MSTISERSEESDLFRTDSPPVPPQDNPANPTPGQGEAAPLTGNKNSLNATGSAAAPGTSGKSAPASQAPPKQEEVELKESNLQIVKKNIRDIDRSAGYIRVSGRPDVVLQVQDGFATIRKKVASKPAPILEPL